MTLGADIARILLNSEYHANLLSFTAVTSQNECFTATTYLIHSSYPDVFRSPQLASSIVKIFPIVRHLGKPNRMLASINIPSSHLRSSKFSEIRSFIFSSSAGLDNNV